jgi:hypothetical protein
MIGCGLLGEGVEKSKVVFMATMLSKIDLPGTKPV